MPTKKEIMAKLQKSRSGKIPLKSSSTISGPLKTAIDKLVNINVTLQDYFVERSETISQMCFALVTGEHVLLKGKPGTAKSSICRALLGAIQDSTVFSIQFSKFMSEDYVFGPINPKVLRDRGEIVHNTSGHIIPADFAFIDEFFDASDVLLRSMLEILNERTFTRGSQMETSPLRSAFLTSNYIRDAEITDAVLDRIIFKNDVQRISDRANRVTMYKHYLHANGSMTKELHDIGFTLEDLDLIVSAVNSDMIQLTDPVLNVYDEVISEFSKQSGVFISDRRANLLLKIIRAVALIDKRTTAKLDDVKDVFFGVATVGVQNETDIFQSVYAKATAKSQEEIIQEGTLETIEVQLKNLQDKDLELLDDSTLLNVNRRLTELANDLKFVGKTPAIEDRRKLAVDTLNDLHNNVKSKLQL